MEIPNPKLQAPEKLQISSFKTDRGRGAHLGFGVWDFSGAWCLELGPSRRLAAFAMFAAVVAFAEPAIPPAFGPHVNLTAKDFAATKSFAAF